MTAVRWEAQVLKALDLLLAVVIIMMEMTMQTSPPAHVSAERPLQRHGSRHGGPSGQGERLAAVEV